MKILEFLQQSDLNLLYVLNVKLQNPIMDRFWLFITEMHKNKFVLFGVVPLILGRLIYIYRWKAIRPLVAAAIAVGVADTIAYRGIKSVVQRSRPFQHAETSHWLRKVGQAHGPSFPSNHAANCFAAATVLSWYFGRRAMMLYSFAILVGLSRVALGVHWPSDVLAGMILGYFVGVLITSALIPRWKWLSWGKPKRKRDANRDDTSWNWRKKSRRLRAD